MLIPEQEQRILTLFRKSSLRTGQRELISWALAGENALAVLPTGHGKSLCYQAAAMLLGGLSVVVSPLIALMRDQVEALERLGLPAGRFDSSLAEEERELLLQRVGAGELRLLFVAPESLENPALIAALESASLSLFVVDEAHCVSAWGHSFRPDYLRLPRWWKQRGFSSMLALTATATPLVRRDLMQAFGIPEERVLALSPYRPNIRRCVQAVSDATACDAALTSFLRVPAHRPAIVYTRTRKGAEEAAGRLQQAGYAAACYHAGQPAELRARLQDDFLSNAVDVLVATIAFGMGVDKPDVRSVIHINLPSSPEAYLQESGRAGRDGAACTSLVCLHGGDAVEARNRIAAAEPDAEGILRCVRWLLPAPRRVVSLWELGTSCDVPEDAVVRALERLEELGAVEVEAEGAKYYKLRPLFSLSTILDGRDECERTRLRWLDAHREGEVESVADAWDCSYAEAMGALRECEASGEWKLTFRQRALCLHALPPAGGGAAAVDARCVAQELVAYYARRQERDLARQEELIAMLSAPGCINAALNRYFMEECAEPLPSSGACGHCSPCEVGSATEMPSYTPPPHPQPPYAELPEFSREGQRRRFLLGIASPGLMARRLWNHPHYGCCAGIPWQQV